MANMYCMNIKQIIYTLGGPGRIGRRLNIKSQAVSQWIMTGRIPAARVIALEAYAREQGLTLRAEDFRPDLDWSCTCGYRASLTS